MRACACVRGRACKMDAETAAASIAVMNNAFDDIFARKHKQLNFEELYCCAYNLTHHKYGLDLYEAIRAALQHHVAAAVRNAESKEEVMLKAGMVRDICLYFNRTYIVTHRLRNIEELATDIYDSHRRLVNTACCK